MAINKRGMTIDLGYPLSEADTEYLFVDLFPELKDRCVEWLKDITNVRPMMLAGQIGTGKTTFLRTILQQLPPLRGKIAPGASLKVGYFAQTHEELNPDNTVLDEFLNHPDWRSLA